VNSLYAVLAAICGLILACHQTVTVTLAGHAYGTSLGVLIVAALIAVCLAAVVITVRSVFWPPASPARYRRSAA